MQSLELLLSTLSQCMTVDGGVERDEVEGEVLNILSKPNVTLI